MTNPAGQYNGIFGGNTALKPETANTVTVRCRLAAVRISVSPSLLRHQGEGSDRSPAADGDSCPVPLDGQSVLCVQRSIADQFGSLWDQ